MKLPNYAFTDNISRNSCKRTGHSLSNDMFDVRRYYVILVIVGICLIVVLLKFTSRGRASLLSVARRAILPYINRNQHAAEQIRTNQLSVAQFHNAAGEEGSRNPTEGNEQQTRGTGDLAMRQDAQEHYICISDSRKNLHFFSCFFSPLASIANLWPGLFVSHFSPRQTYEQFSQCSKRAGDWIRMPKIDWV